MLNHGTGWVQTDASRKWLRHNERHFALAAFRAATIPSEIDPRPNIAIKDQGQMGSCSGFSRSTLEQLLNDIAAGSPQKLVFSAMYAYLENQKADNSFGSDSGATIAGSVQAALTTGICLDSLFPYTGRYTTNIPAAATAEGPKHLIASHSVLTSYAAALQYLGTAGVIQIGVPVGNAFQNCSGVLSLQDVQSDAANPEGGHALSIVGYPSQQMGGRNPFILLNSWGTSWGDSGSCLVDPAAWDFWCSQMNRGDVEIIGMSKLPSFDGGPIDWSNLYATA